MIGEEFAHHVSPLAGLRVFSPFQQMTCDVCGAVDATCTSQTPPQPEPFDVRSAVTERAAQQTRRPVGRPPKDPAKRAAKEAGAALAPGESYVPQPGPAVNSEGREVSASPSAPVSSAPAGDPTEVRDVYVVPDGLVDPADDPHRPNPETSVLVSDPSQLIATGAWMTLPNNTTIAMTRDVLRVFWPMGSIRPSYAMVAAVGSVRPKPAP